MSARAAVLLSTLLAVVASAADQPYVFTTFAGAPPSLVAVQPLDHPYDVAVDANGNVFIADTFNDVIRKLSPSGELTIFAGQFGKSGSSDGNGTAAQFHNPKGLTIDRQGNLFVADENNYTIRKITPSGDVTTIAGKAGSFGSADGNGSSARFDSPSGVAADANGNVYVADSSNGTIRKISPSGDVTTLAGKAGTDGYADGTGSAAFFNDPENIAVDAAGNIYVADALNNVIRKVTPSGKVTTVAGGSAANPGSADGNATTARFQYPRDVAVDASGNLYVADQENATIRKITPSGQVTTLAGKAGATGATDGVGADARFYDPWGVAVDSLGNVYVADSHNSAIRKITPQALVTTLGSAAVRQGTADGFGTAARFNSPHGIAVDHSGNVFVADTFNQTIRKISPSGEVTTFAGTAGVSGNQNGTGTAATFDFPSDVAVDASGNVFVADEFNNSVRKITPSGQVSTYATGFRFHEGIAVDDLGNVYVTGTDQNDVKMIRPTGEVVTLAGGSGSGSVDGVGSAARFHDPRGIAVDRAGNIYVADTFNDTIRKITPSGNVTTFAGAAGQSGTVDGNGNNARFVGPVDLAFDDAGNLIVVDAAGTIRKITPSRDVTTIGGAPAKGDVDGAGQNARFNIPEGIAIGPDGRLFIADSGNHAIRVGALPQPRRRGVRH